MQVLQADSPASAKSKTSKRLKIQEGSGQIRPNGLIAGAQVRSMVAMETLVQISPFVKSTDAKLARLDAFKRQFRTPMAHRREGPAIIESASGEGSS